MILLDVNVLVYACRRDAERHQQYRAWLSDTLASGDPVGVAPESMAAVVRITTHPRLWKVPLTLAQAFAFTGAVLSAGSTLLVQPGPRHWELFESLCRRAKGSGNLVMDAWLAATALEQGCTLVTTDRDFRRFPGLRWMHPLDG